MTTTRVLAALGLWCGHTLAAVRLDAQAAPPNAAADSAFLLATDDPARSPSPFIGNGRVGVVIPPLGIVGAALALVGSYLVVLGLMYVFTQRLFPIPYEWRRLASIVVVAAALVGFAEAFVPTSGAGGLVIRVALWAAFPAALLATGFLTHAERDSLRVLLRPGAVAERLRDLRSEPRPAPGPAAVAERESLAPHFTPETYEQAIRDDDRGA